MARFVWLAVLVVNIGSPVETSVYSNISITKLEAIQFNTTVRSLAPYPGDQDSILVVHHLGLHKLNLQTGRTQLIAGSLVDNGYEEGRGALAKFEAIQGITIVSNTTVIVSDSNNWCLREIDLVTGQTSLFAGRCLVSGSEDGDRITTARFAWPRGLLSIKVGIVVADLFNDAVRMIIGDQVQTLHSGDPIRRPSYLSEDGPYIFVTTSTGVVSINKRTNSTKMVAGGSETSFEDGPLSAARFNDPQGIAKISPGLFLVSDYRNARVRLLNLEADQVTTICSGMAVNLEKPNACPGTLHSPWTILLHTGGLALIADSRQIQRLRIDSVTLDLITNVSMSRAEIIQSKTNFITSLARHPTEPDSLLVLHHYGLHKLSDQTFQLISGSWNESGYTEGQGENARFRATQGIVVINNTMAVVADSNNHCLRQVSLVTGQTTPFAGQCWRSIGDADGENLDATFNWPRGLLLMDLGIVVADHYNDALRLVTGGQVTTLHKGGPIRLPNYLINDYNSIFVTTTTGVVGYDISTKIAYQAVGGNLTGYQDGSLPNARFNDSIGISRIAPGVWLVADYRNVRLRLVNLPTNTTSTMCTGAAIQSAGHGTPCPGTLIFPWSILTIDEQTTYVTESGRIQKLQLEVNTEKLEVTYEELLNIRVPPLVLEVDATTQPIQPIPVDMQHNETTTPYIPMETENNDTPTPSIPMETETNGTTTPNSAITDPTNVDNLPLIILVVVVVVLVVICVALAVIVGLVFRRRRTRNKQATKEEQTSNNSKRFKSRELPNAPHHLNQPEVGYELIDGVYETPSGDAAPTAEGIDHNTVRDSYYQNGFDEYSGPYISQY